MRQTETMRAVPRLLLSHPIVCLVAALAAAVVLGVLGPINVVRAADVTVEGESFNRPASGTNLITGAGYSGGEALKFTDDVAASHTFNCSAPCDVVLRASGGQSGGQASFSVNGSTPQALTSTATTAYTFHLAAGATTISVKAGGTGTGHNAILDVATFSASDGGTDTTPPDTTLSPPSVIGTTASFTFSSNEPSSFQCRLVGLEPNRIDNCLSPRMYSNLTVGTQYTFKVWAKDAAGNIDPTPAMFTFTPSSSSGTDTTPPDTTLSPPSVIGTTASFTFSSNEPSSFQCRLVGLEPNRIDNCLSPRMYSNLTVGTQYTFKVWAKDAAGNIDPTPATFTFTPSDGTTPPPGTTAHLAGAGDIATRGQDNDTLTGNLIEQLIVEHPDLRVFTAGDNAYQDGTLAQFNNYYHPAWGSFKNITSPTPGNHDWHTSGAQGYKQYFGTVPNLRSVNPTWYAYNLGAWRVYALDSESSMGTTSAQYDFVQKDLIANRRPCMLAYWHHPVISSGMHGNSANARPIFALMDKPEHDVDLVLNGHDHNYEAFVNINADLKPDPAGIREIIVGTGGVNTRAMGTTKTGSEFRRTGTHGVLHLTLEETGYTGEFIATSGSIVDSFNGSCLADR
jgi:Calcineurin-like phosphoesterase/Bacterial Ig-like domain (group 3)